MSGLTGEGAPGSGAATGQVGPGAVVGPVRVGPVAHGGHCVARHEGRVVFVRHSLPGELVDVRLTDTGHDSYWRGDAVTVHEPAAERTEAPCPASGPGRCGGCDFQHVSLFGQRRLKTDVVREQLERLAGWEWSGAVEPLPGEVGRDGLGWRTRMRYVADPTGRLGLRRHREHALEPVPADGCPISDPRGRPRAGGWPAGAEVGTAVDGHGSVAVQVGRERVVGPAVLAEPVGDVDLAVAPDGFWQVHPAAARTFVEVVLAGLEPRPGERAFDLYCGVGLFARALADRGVRVWGVESSRAAVRHAERNLAAAGAVGARFTAGRVEQVLRRLPARTDLVVLDPPRTGAGRAVVEGVLARTPRRVAYVACDPAALARDLRRVLDAGWQICSLRAFDAFPMTHHVECVAVLEPGGGV